MTTHEIINKGQSILNEQDIDNLINKGELPQRKLSPNDYYTKKDLLTILNEREINKVILMFNLRNGDKLQGKVIVQSLDNPDAEIQIKKSWLKTMLIKLVKIVKELF